jgi:hypothetical protein
MRREAPEGCLPGPDLRRVVYPCVAGQKLAADRSAVIRYSALIIWELSNQRTRLQLGIELVPYRGDGDGRGPSIFSSWSAFRPSPLLFTVKCKALPPESRGRNVSTSRSVASASFG